MKCHKEVKKTVEISDAYMLQEGNISSSVLENESHLEIPPPIKIKKEKILELR